MKSVGLILAASLVLLFGVSSLSAYPLTLEQRDRFNRYLERTFPKLEARDPVHVVALGDSVMGGYTPLPSAWEPNNPLYSYTGIFLMEVAREFFYPGGVRLLNPPPQGTGKISGYLGDEITLENLTEIDGTSLDGLRHVAADAFLHEPDLLLIQYGVYDAFGEVPVDVYRRALQGMIDAAKENSVDVILFAPCIVQYGAGVIDWGVTRPYAMAAREVAATNGVLFIDPGQHLSRFGGGVDPNTEAPAAMEIVSERLSRIFHFGPELRERERVHPSRRANEYLGERMFEELKFGPPSSKFTFAGVANFSSDGQVEVVVAIQNQSPEVQRGTLGALAVAGGLVPVERAKRFSVPPDATTQVAITYRRPIVGQARDGSDILFPLEPGDEFTRFSFILEDSVGSELVDLPLRIGPITAVWKTRQFRNVTDRLRVEWDLVNGTDKAVSGTFQVGMGEKVGVPTPFSVTPLGTKTVFSIFDFIPGGEDAFQQEIWIQTEVDGNVTRFYREMEASRDVVLGEEVVMRSWLEYVNAPPPADPSARMRSEGRVVARWEANEDALYLIAGIEGLTVPDLGDQAALRTRIFLDARPTDEVMTFGAIKPLDVYTKGNDGPGFTPAIALGSFGRGYNLFLAPKGITSALRTADSGKRILEVRIPRSYLHQHDWSLGSLESILGIRIELTVAASAADAEDPFPLANSFVSNSPTFAFENRTIRGFSERDARSLSTLRLSRQPVQSWSVRIY